MGGGWALLTSTLLPSPLLPLKETYHHYHNNPTAKARSASGTRNKLWPRWFCSSSHLCASPCFDFLCSLWSTSECQHPVPGNPGVCELCPVCRAPCILETSDPPKRQQHSHSEPFGTALCLHPRTRAGQQHWLPPFHLPTMYPSMDMSSKQRGHVVGVRWFISVMNRGAAGVPRAPSPPCCALPGPGCPDDVLVVLGKLLPTYSLWVQPRICPGSREEN